MSTNTASK